MKTRTETRMETRIRFGSLKHARPSRRLGRLRSAMQPIARLLRASGQLKIELLLPACPTVGEAERERPAGPPLCRTCGGEPRHQRPADRPGPTWSARRPLAGRPASSCATRLRGATEAARSGPARALSCMPRHCPGDRTGSNDYDGPRPLLAPPPSSPVAPEAREHAARRRTGPSWAVQFEHLAPSRPQDHEKIRTRGATESLRLSEFRPS